MIVCQVEESLKQSSARKVASLKASGVYGSKSEPGQRIVHRIGQAAQRVALLGGAVALSPHLGEAAGLVQ